MCEKCGNTMGFALGTCVECGWNDLDKSFHFIKVQVAYLEGYPDLKRLLVEKHARRYEGRAERAKAAKT
jgi:anaerobic ribonucleoside-triphosphate reductase